MTMRDEVLDEAADTLELNPQSFVIPFDTVPAVGSAPKVLAVHGRYFGLNPTTARMGDASLVVSVEDQGGNQHYMEPGSRMKAQRFTRLFLNRPSHVPSDSNRSYHLDVFWREGQVQYGPIPPHFGVAGTANVARTRNTAQTATIGGVAVADTLVAARVGRRRVTIFNEGVVPEEVFIATGSSPAAATWDRDDANVLRKLDPGDSVALEYTGALYVVSITGAEAVVAVEEY